MTTFREKLVEMKEIAWEYHNHYDQKWKNTEKEESRQKWYRESTYYWGQYIALARAVDTLDAQLREEKENCPF